MNRHPGTLLLLSTGIVLAGEAGAVLLQKVMLPLPAMAVTRLVQVLLIAVLVGAIPNGVAWVGLSRKQFGQGVKTGGLWSLAIGGTVAVMALFFRMAGFDPVHWIRADLPRDHLFFFILVGSLVAPLAEELYFRGILYVYLREISVPGAVVVSSLAFGVCHFSGNGIPGVQIIGGILFAVSFESSKSLLAPLIIHVFGNLAIFSISGLL